MKLALRLFLLIFVGILLVQAANGISRVGYESSLFEFDIRRDQRLLGKAIAGATAKVWRTHGEVDALEVVGDANDLHSHLRIAWVRLDALPSGPTPDGEATARLLAGFPVTRVVERPDGERYMETHAPVRHGGALVGAISLSESLAEERAYVRRIVVRTVAVTVITAAICGVVTFVLGLLLVGRPIRKLVSKARRVGAGDLAGHVELRQRDEVGDLARELDQMSDHLAKAQERVAAETASRIAAMEQLRHADRLSTVGKLAAGIAHELGTPLNVVMGRARMIASGEVVGKQAAEGARIVAEQAERMTRIIRNLLDFARRRGPQRAGADLAQIARTTLALLEPLARKRSVVLRYLDRESPAVAMVDADQMQQALTNVVMNGIQAMAEGGELTVEVRRERAQPPADHGGPAADCSCVVVSDQGPGIAPDELPHIFEPFFTTKEVGEGSGLGLSVVYGIVRENGGWVAVDTQVGQGSRFSIYLPVAAEAEPGPPAAAETKAETAAETKAETEGEA